MKGYTVIECTKKFSKKFKYELFDEPVKDMDAIEYWEGHLALIGHDKALVQVYRKNKAGQIKVLGYNILTERPV